MTVQIQGFIGAERMTTDDDRILQNIDYYSCGRIPVYYLDMRERGDNKIIGWFEARGFVSSEMRILWGTGEVERWPRGAGEYLGCGMDMDCIEVGEQPDGSWLGGGRLIIEKARLMGLTVYSFESGMKPAWPFVQIWRAG